MTTPTRRTLLRNSPGARRDLADLLQAVMTAELLRPSSRLWVASTVLADAPVLDNRAGGFTALEPSWSERSVGLIDVLLRNLTLGGQVAVVVGKGPDGEQFLRRLRDAAEATGVAARLETHSAPSVPVQGIAGEGFHLSGALAWTVTGVTIAEEGITFEAGMDAGARADTLFQQAYGGGVA
jgi:hypothetical protein